MHQKIINLLSSMIMLTLIGCATTPSPETQPQAPLIKPFQTLPYALTSEGLYTVRVSLNGEGAYPFLIDTGATISVLYENTLRDLQVASIPQETTTVHGILESAVRPVVTLDEMAVGSIRKANPRFAILETNTAEPGLAGILGMDFLKDQSLIFDHERQEIDFTVSAQFDSPEYQDWNFIRLTPNPYTEEDFGLLFMYMTFAGYRNPALLDLGASISIANWAASQNRQMRTYRRRLREEWEIEGAIGEFRPRLTARISFMYAGEHTWYDHIVLVLDLETLNIIGTEGTPLILAGADLFEETTFALDFSGNRIYVKPTAEYLKRQADKETQTGTRLRGVTSSSSTVEIKPAGRDRRDDQKSGENEN